MDIKLQTYYNKSNNFKKQLIDWCRLDEENVKNKESLKPITDEDIINLDKQMNELDGTLLVDVVRRFMRNHKIFI